MNTINCFKDQSLKKNDICIRIDTNRFWTREHSLRVKEFCSRLHLFAVHCTKSARVMSQSHKILICTELQMSLRLFATGATPFSQRWNQLKLSQNEFIIEFRKWISTGTIHQTWMCSSYHGLYYSMKLHVFFILICVGGIIPYLFNIAFVCLNLANYLHFCRYWTQHFAVPGKCACKCHHQA